MKIDHIRELVHKVPFLPFTIHTAGGPVAYVPHPDFIALGPTGRTVFVVRPDETTAWIDLLLVSQIEVHGHDVGVTN